jgi:hypothetical protein
MIPLSFRVHQLTNFIMIRVFILLVALLQVAVCKPLLGWSSECITTTHKVNAKDCQDIIDPMRGKCFCSR